MLGLGSTPSARRPPLEGLIETIVQATNHELAHGTLPLLSLNDSAVDRRFNRRIL